MKRCSRCGGMLFAEEDLEAGHVESCLQCGGSFYESVLSREQANAERQRAKYFQPRRFPRRG